MYRLPPSFLPSPLRTVHTPLPISMAYLQFALPCSATNHPNDCSNHPFSKEQILEERQRDFNSIMRLYFGGRNYRARYQVSVVTDALFVDNILPRYSYVRTVYPHAYYSLILIMIAAMKLKYNKAWYLLVVYLLYNCRLFFLSLVQISTQSLVLATSLENLVTG